jgi:2-keto-4-pentenoate hydratase/2-oxohepta-3-ene-1,7-dioic acid hydratase in catechol pathway
VLNEGVGFTRNPPLWLKAGDQVEVELEGVGVLKNIVVAESGPTPNEEEARQV